MLVLAAALLFPPVGFDHVLIVPSPFPSELMCPCAVQLAFFFFIRKMHVPELGHFCAAPTPVLLVASVLLVVSVLFA